MERGNGGSATARGRVGGPRGEGANGAGGASILGDDDRWPVYAGRLEIRPADRAALVDGRPLALTVRELQLLAELAENAERVMTREQLCERIWGRPYEKTDRSVDVYVGRLRSKLDRALPGRRFIHTHTGIGYRFSPDG